MKAHLLRRLLLLVPTWVGITLVTFVLIHLAPGDPAQLAAAQTDGRISAADVQQLRVYLRLDDPLATRYASWLWSALRLDWGRSFADGQLVSARISRALGPTAAISGIALLVGTLGALWLGALAARHRESPLDSVTSVVLYALYTIPPYVLAMPLILLLGVRCDALPFRGMTSDNFTDLSWPARFLDLLRHAALIIICLTVPILAYLARFVRAGLLDQLGRPYVRTARAKGASRPRVVRAHALPNALIPLITLLGLMLPGVVSGSVVLEVIFSWPGIGRLLYDALLQRDIPIIMGATSVSAAVVLGGTLLADLACLWADPRSRHE